MEGKVLIESLQLKNFLSYGPQSKAISLLPLNVLIGPNGSGKSNLIEILNLLRTFPTDISTFFRQGMGFNQWLWKGENSTHNGLKFPLFELSVETRMSKSGDEICSHKCTILPGHFTLVLETIEIQTDAGKLPVYVIEGKQTFLYRTIRDASGTNSRQQIIIGDEGEGEEFDHEQSVLSQIKDRKQYPEITQLGQSYSAIRIFRNWNLGRNTPPRQLQPADLANDFLAEDASNLALIINDLQNKPGVKRQIIKHLQQFNPQFEDITTLVYGNTVQLFLHEKGLKETIPATRLSDGTLQFLCLLAILCHPEPPPLVCIEEPELGLHPDVMPILAELLLEASQRMQLIVSTHSDALVSALSSTPEAILVCERDENGTQLKRLEAKPLAAWLEKYSLGDLWRMGEIGGVRW